MWNEGLDEAQAQARFKIAGRNINNLRYVDDTTLMAESEKELESLDEDVRGEWKRWFETQHSKNEDSGIQSHHLMANRWGNETVREIIFLGSKITADGDFSHEIFLKNASFLEEKLWPT